MAQTQRYGSQVSRLRIHRLADRLYYNPWRRWVINQSCVCPIVQSFTCHCVQWRNICVRPKPTVNLSTKDKCGIILALVQCSLSFRSQLSHRHQLAVCCQQSAGSCFSPARIYIHDQYTHYTMCINTSCYSPKKRYQSHKHKQLFNNINNYSIIQTKSYTPLDLLLLLLSIAPQLMQLVSHDWLSSFGERM